MVQCTVVVNAVLSNSFLSVATAVSVHLAEPSTPLTVLLPCLLRYSIRTIVTVSLPLTLNSDIPFSKIEIFFLFKAVQSVIFRLFFKDNKSENFTPGFILVLHTFGRDLKWNPHIHCLVSEGGIGSSGLWRAKTHFNYTFLRNAFRTSLLNLLEEKLGSSFKKVKAGCYLEHKDGFYVYAKPNKCNPKVVTKYIGRYLGRPVIATSRIDSYDGESVTFHYNRHEDNQLVTETIPVMDFIQRLIQHIPEKHFKQIRYYGLYARNRKSDKKLNLAIAKEKQHMFLSFNRWRDCTLSSFGYDPLKCPCCGETMLFLELYHNHQHISLNEMYERTMQRFQFHSSA